MNEELILNVSENSPYVIGARAYVTQTENGAVITITDKEGTTTATVLNGADGRSISSITLNDDYTLTILYTDGTTDDTSSIRGETGASGVYCGEEEPIDPDVDVWVDPSDGDGSVLKLKENGNWIPVRTIVGEAAGFGTVSATVDANHGTPSVTVTTSGEDTAKNFAFAFSNLQPAPYDDSELQNDFAVLQGQFDTAVSAVTTDTEVTDIRVGADGVTDTTAGASVRRQFTDVKSAINDIQEKVGTKTGNLFDGTPLTIEHYYNSEGTLVSNASWHISPLFNIGDYEYIEYKGLSTVGTAPYSVWFDASQNVLSTFKQAVGDNILAVPSGAKYVSFSIANPDLSTFNIYGLIETIFLEKAKTALNSHRNFVKVDANGKIWIKTKYNNLYDIGFKFAKRGGNNLPDFDSIFLISNSGELNDDFSVAKTILTNSTDFFSPFIVSADSNRDGDNITSYYFTGGNHRTTNEETGGGATATNVSLNVYADGRVPTADGVFCNSVEIVWENNIQAFNTSKADGTGRNVLNEKIKATFEGALVKCRTVHKALENIHITTYYGLQMLTAPFDSVEFVGGSNRLAYNCNEVANCGNKKCRNIIVRNDDGDIVEVSVATTDLGDFEMCTSSQVSAFNTQYGKSYFNVIRSELSAIPFSSGELFYLDGYYRFSNH